MKFKKWVERYPWVWAVVGTLVLWMLISIIAGSVSLQSLLLNATLASFLILIAFGQMTVITSGDGAIDLSLPYIVTLAAFVSSKFMMGGNIKILPGLIITILVCCFIGLLNGLINVYLKVPAIITTLAMGYIVFSLTLIYSYTTTGAPNPGIALFTKLRYGSLSSLTVLCVIIAVLLAIVMYKTKFGKQLHATGQSRRAAELAGINVNRTVITSFLISAFLGAVTGVLLILQRAYISSLTTP
ncbi:MAG: ABC transporter permease [Thermacetogeniaceae bacterium]